MTQEEYEQTQDDYPFPDGLCDLVLSSMWDKAHKAVIEAVVKKREEDEREIWHFADKFTPWDSALCLVRRKSVLPCDIAYYLRKEKGRGEWKSGNGEVIPDGDVVFWAYLTALMPRYIKADIK